MSINNGYDEKVVTEAIATALETFYNNLIAKIDELNIQKMKFSPKTVPPCFPVSNRFPQN